MEKALSPSSFCPYFPSAQPSPGQPSPGQPANNAGPLFEKELFPSSSYQVELGSLKNLGCLHHGSEFCR